MVPIKFKIENFPLKTRTRNQSSFHIHTNFDDGEHSKKVYMHCCACRASKIGNFSNTYESKRYASVLMSEMKELFVTSFVSLHKLLSLIFMLHLHTRTTHSKSESFEVKYVYVLMLCVCTCVCVCVCAREGGRGVIMAIPIREHARRVESRWILITTTRRGEKESV